MPGLGWKIGTGTGFLPEKEVFPVPGLDWITGLGFPLWEEESFPMPRLGLGFISSWEGVSFPCARSRLDEWYQYRVPFGKKSFPVLGLG